MQLIKDVFQDPGLLRLKLACRTIITVIIAMAIMIPLGKIYMVWAGFSAMFISMAVYGYTWLEKIESIVLIGIAYIIAHMLGHLVKGHLVATDIALIVAAFFAFYVRRFGAKFMLFPVFSWVFILLSTLLPAAGDNVGLNITPIAVSAAVTMIITILVLPERKHILFLRHIENQLSENQQLLSYLAHAIEKRPASIAFIKKAKQFKDNTQTLLLNNQTINGDFNDKHYRLSKEMNQLMLIQYGLSKAISIIHESLRSLFYIDDKEIKYTDYMTALQKSLSKLSRLHQHIHCLKNNFQFKLDISFDDYQQISQVLEEKLLDCDLKDNMHAIYLYYIQTGVSFYLKYIKQLTNEVSHENVT